MEKTYKIAASKVVEHSSDPSKEEAGYVSEEHFYLEGINPEGYAFKQSGTVLGSDLKVVYEKTVIVSESETETDRIELTEGKDYKVTYKNNKKAGKATVTVTFIGNYKGTKSVSGTFTVNKAVLSDDMEGLRIGVADKVYGKAGVYKSAPYVTLNGIALKSSDYSVKYYTDAAMESEMGSKNKISLLEGEKEATVYVKITGKGNYEGTLTATYKVVRKEGTDLSKGRISFYEDEALTKKITKMEYTGEEVTPYVKVEVKEGKVWKVVPEDTYRVTYVNNVNKGKATVIVTGKGDSYVGSKTGTFSIVAWNIKNVKNLFAWLFQ